MQEDEPDDTARLVRASKSGSDEPFEEQYGRVAASLYAWARIRLDRVSLPGLEAEDVLQEVWLRAHRVFAGFDPCRSSFRAWTVGIAKNVLLEEYRRREPSQPFRPEASGSDSQLERCPDSVTSITTRMARDEALQAFLDAVHALDPVDGMILLHHGFEDFTQAETATRLGLSAEVVKKRWQRLCTKLCEGGIGYQLLLPRAD